MRKAKNRFERSRQVFGWLQSIWPAGRPVELIWVNEIFDEDRDGARYQCRGQTYREGRHLVIELSSRKCRSWDIVNGTLIHEYVHAVQWGPASLEHRTEHHPVAFYALLGEIENCWEHDHGDEQANDFPF